MIVKTEGYTLVSSGVYRSGDDMSPTHLSQIEKWEYDMLDAFGVTVIEPDEYRRLRHVRATSDHCRG